MINRYNKILLPLFFMVDLIIVGFSYCLGYFIRFNESIFDDPRYYSILFVILILWGFLSLIFKTYHEHRGKSLATQLGNLYISKALFLLGLSLYIIIIKGYFFSRAFLVLFMGLDIVIMSLIHILRHYVMVRHRRAGGNFKRVLLLGDLPENGNGGTNFFPPETGHKIEKHIPMTELTQDIEKARKRIKQEIEKSDYDILLVGAPLEFGKQLSKIVDTAENYGLRVSFFPHFIKSLNYKIEINYIDGIPLINVRTEPLKFLHNKLIKRMLDLLIAGIAFITVYWWFRLIVGAIIKLSSRGPVIFRQKRVGIDGKEFWFYKFRTMSQPKNVTKAVNGERGITKEDDPRVTHIGKCLRKTNLDELPQIINVLKGDMSIVGPRPHMLQEDLEVRKKVPKYMVRQFVKPGITGLAAVKGYRGGTENMRLMKKRVEHDIHYIEFWSFWLDIKIIMQTLWQMATFNIPNAY